MALHNDVLAQQMWRFLCNDIDSRLTVNQDIEALGAQSKFKRGLNFPAALTMFAMVDLAASYYTGKEATTGDIAKFIYCGGSAKLTENARRFPMTARPRSSSSFRGLATTRSRAIRFTLPGNIGPRRLKSKPSPSASLSARELPITSACARSYRRTSARGYCPR